MTPVRASPSLPDSQLKQLETDLFPKITTVILAVLASVLLFLTLSSDTAFFITACHFLIIDACGLCPCESVKKTSTTPTYVNVSISPTRPSFGPYPAPSPVHGVFRAPVGHQF